MAIVNPNIIEVTMEVLFMVGNNSKFFNIIIKEFIFIDSQEIKQWHCKGLDCIISTS